MHSKPKATHVFLNGAHMNSQVAMANPFSSRSLYKVMTTAMHGLQPRRKASKLVRRISIVPDKCTGCRSCEIACSYHFDGVFQPNTSRIKISFDPKSGDVKISIDDGCNLCEGEEGPLCAKYCSAGALIFQAK